MIPSHMVFAWGISNPPQKTLTSSKEITSTAMLSSQGSEDSSYKSYLPAQLKAGSSPKFQELLRHLFTFAQCFNCNKCKGYSNCHQ